MCSISKLLKHAGLATIAGILVACGATEGKTPLKPPWYGNVLFLFVFFLAGIQGGQKLAAKLTDVPGFGFLRVIAGLAAILGSYPCLVGFQEMSRMDQASLPWMLWATSALVPGLAVGFLFYRRSAVQEQDLLRASMEPTVRAPFSDLSQMGTAVSDKMKAVAEAMEGGLSLDEAIRQVDGHRKRVLTAIARTEHQFVAYLESTISAKARRDFESQVKSEEEYLVAAIESYKQRAYRPAIDYCNGSLSYNRNSARATALRGLVYAAQVSPDYVSALSDLEQAVRLEPANNLYNQVLQTVRSALG